MAVRTHPFVARVPSNKTVAFWRKSSLNFDTLDVWILDFSEGFEHLA